MKPIDIFLTAYLREELTLQTIEYLRKRTNYPYRLWLIDQGETNSQLKNTVDQYIGLKNNIGINGAWNMALSLAESDYFITSDNDIYVPDTRNMGVGYSENKMFIFEKPDQPDWLTLLKQFMDERPDYGAISLHPHVFIGAAGIDPTDLEDVEERNMCGAVMRIMRRDAVWKAGGWEHIISAGRNHEERTICSRLQANGYKVGITSRLRAFHPFPPNWGYPESFTPEQQKHNPELKDYVTQFGNMEAYDDKTWMLLK